MVDPIVSFALEKLDDFITKEFQLASKLRKDAQWLRSELGFLQSFLQDAEGHGEAESRLHRYLVWEIKDIARETVNLLDKFRQREGEAAGGGWIGLVRHYSVSCSCRGFDIGEEMEFLKERVMEISRRRNTYDIQPPSFTRRSSGLLVGRALRRATSYMDAEYPVVGLQDVKHKFLAKLLKDNRHLSIVSIYGMGGLGKTTLARDLYNSSEVVSNFSKRAWTCVSQEIIVPEILRSVIKSFKKGCSPQELEIMEVLKSQEDMERYLRELLDGHKYVIVIDDVSDREILKILKRSFPDFRNGSRLIVTTRKGDVATRVDGTIYADKLRFLSREESLKLFNQKLSYTSHGYGVADHYSQLKTLGNDILDKCGGLPLAIVVLRGLLAHKRPEEWFKVKENIWSYLDSDSIEISHLLSLSFDDLSSELKECFLYLGIFSESQAIDSEKLMHLWMAEELITVPRGRMMEDVAQDYLMELINRSLIQVEKSFWGKISKLRVHDLLRSLAVEKALEVNFFNIYDPQAARPSFHICRRHVVRAELINEYFNGCGYLRELRSLHLFHNSVPPHSFTGQFHNLAVLNLEGVDLSLDSGALCQVTSYMIHLKFLGLTNANTNTTATILDHSLGGLKHLQTLEVLSHDVTTTCVLPRTTSQLQNLRHIIARVDGGADHIGALSNLTTLRTISYSSWNTIKTQNLQNLRELVIEGIGEDSSQGIEHIGLLKNLDTLVLRTQGPDGHSLFPNLKGLSPCDNLRRLWLDGIINTYGMWPQSVTMLKLSNAKLVNDLSSIPEKFPNLRCLDIYASFMHSLVFSSEGSPCLEFLSLCYIDGLHTLELKEGAAPNIKAVYIKGCPELSDISRRLKSVRVPENEVEADSMFVFHCYPRIL